MSSSPRPTSRHRAWTDPSLSRKLRYQALRDASLSPASRGQEWDALPYDGNVINAMPKPTKSQSSAKSQDESEKDVDKPLVDPSEAEPQHPRRSNRLSVKTQSTTLASMTPKNNRTNRTDESADDSINNHPSDSLEISLEQNAEEPPDLDRRVFIYFHDIHTSIDAETMKASFEKCGEVKECTTFLEKYWGYVDVVTVQAREAALEGSPHEINDHVVHADPIPRAPANELAGDFNISQHTESRSNVSQHSESSDEGYTTEREKEAQEHAKKIRAAADRLYRLAEMLERGPIECRTTAEFLIIALLD